MENLVKIENKQIVTDSRQIAEHFGKRHADVLESISKLYSTENSVQSMFFQTSYKDTSGKSNKVYLMNRDGFTLLAMGFTGKKALEWKLKYINAFNEMEAQQQPKTQIDLLVESAIALQRHEHEIKRMQQAQEATIKRLDTITDVITLTSDEWRKDTRTLIMRMAVKAGDMAKIRDLYHESYQYLDNRMGVSVETRLINMKKRMYEQGYSKTRMDKVNVLDVIGQDKKLVEGYLSVVKDMALKYGVD